MIMNEHDIILTIILTKVEELDELMHHHAKSLTSRDIMAHKLNAIRRTAENAIKRTEK